MTQKHAYTAQVEWTGNRGTGTSSYRAYDRSCQITAPGKAEIAASSDPAFRGDPARWNPEELLVASLATCHQLWYLHLCAEAGVIAHSYHDTAQGLMEELPDGSGQFLEVTLHPAVEISADSDEETAIRLHASAHRHCFIARSVHFPIACLPTIRRLAP